MCNHSSSGKRGKVADFSAWNPASMVVQIVVVRDLQTTRLLLLPPPLPPPPPENDVGGSHHSQSCTPAHVLASGAARSARGMSLNRSYAAYRPFNPKIMSSVAQILATFGNWFCALNALMMVVEEEEGEWKEEVAVVVVVMAA